MLSIFIYLTIAFASEKMAFMMETSQGEKTIWIQDKDLQQVKTSHKISIYPFLSKNGDELAYVAGPSENDLYVYIKNLNLNTTTQITKSPAFVLHPHISSNGDFISYSTNEGETATNNKNHIVVWNRKLLTQTIINDDSPLYFPKISSNGSFLVYQKTLSQKSKQIWKFDMHTKTSELLSDGFEKCMAPNLNFDDSVVVMTCYKDNMWNLFTLRLSDKTVHQITHTTQESFAPTFDRFNNIIFASLENEVFELQKLSLNLKNQTYESPYTLLRLPGNLYAPSISGNLTYSKELPTQVPNPSRSSFGAIHVKNKIFIFGGHQGREHTYPPESFLNQLDIYNIQSKSWTQGAPRPVLAHGYGVESCGNSIFAFGGFSYSTDHKPRWKSLSQIDRYDISKNTWKTIGHLRAPRSSHVVAKVGNKIYLIGGWDSTPKFENDKDGTFHQTIEVFNCTTQKLEEEIFSLPAPLRRAFTGVVHNEKILLLGGISESANHFSLINNVTEFDPATKTFQELEPLPFPTFAPASGILKNELHIFGGMFKTSETTYEYVNHTYSLQNKSWTHTGRYLTDSKGFSSVVPVKNSLWIIGGHSYDNNTDAPVHTIEVWK